MHRFQDPVPRITSVKVCWALRQPANTPKPEALRTGGLGQDFSREAAKLYLSICPPRLTPLLPLHPEVNESAERRSRADSLRVMMWKRGAGKGSLSSGSRAKPLKAAQARKAFHEGLQRPTQLYPVFTKDHPSRPSLPQVHGLTSRSLHWTLNPVYAGCPRRSTSAAPIGHSDAGGLGERANQSSACWRVRSAGARLRGRRPSNPLRLGYWGPWFLGVVAPRVHSEPSEKGLSSGVGSKNMKKQKA